MAEQKFEDTLNRLEKIVDDLESGELNLDDAIKKYEEGIKLSTLCGRKLNEVKKRIEVLVKEPSGKITEKDFDESKYDEDNTTVKPKQTRKKSRPKGEKYLF